MVAIFDKEHIPDLTDRLSNELLGLPILTEKEAAAIVKDAVKNFSYTESHKPRN